MQKPSMFSVAQPLQTFPFVGDWNIIPLLCVMFRSVGERGGHKMRFDRFRAVVSFLQRAKHQSVANMRHLSRKKLPLDD